MLVLFVNINLYVKVDNIKYSSVIKENIKKRTPRPGLEPGTKRLTAACSAD